MDYQLYENSDVLLNDNSDSKQSWSIPSDCSMDNNEYFGWNSLKIDEENEQGKATRKRKLSGNMEERKDKQNGFKLAKDPLSIDDKPAPAKKASGQKGSGKMPQWQVEDYTDLNTDIETSLSLGTELANNSYNVSEALLSMNNMTVFKQEAPSPTSNEIPHLQVAIRQPRQSPSSTQQINPVNSTMEDNSQNMFNSTINQLLSQTALVNLHNVMDSNNLTTSPNSQDNYAVTSTNYNLMIEDYRFQYVLAAATSIATKQNEDTLTYLNQGQSYEIKLKKLGDLSLYRGKLLKSVIRICFHERRLQYMEKEQMESWQRARPGDRILEVDVPLSYGAYDVIQPSSALNLIHFNWDPTKEVGVYIKVNCISTEFTPKKHGGEKGVPFRIQVETYQYPDSSNSYSTKRLHAAACQIKVFKLKGADRKHKQDREKIMKRPIAEQEKYQPSYECTVLNDLPTDAVLNTPPITPVSPDPPPESSPQLQRNEAAVRVDNVVVPVTNNAVSTQKPVSSPVAKDTKRENVVSAVLGSNGDNNSIVTQQSSPEELVQWLKLNRFDNYSSSFARFSGDDILRMSRNDLIQICGDADGIRLHNALHLKAIVPKVKIYVCRENSSVFHAIFLSSHDTYELLSKLCPVVGISQEQVHDIYMEGPQGIHIKMSVSVLQHIKEETMFSLHLVPDQNGFVFLLKCVMP
ncbi:hypothetical protein NQ315_006938 [Exocentrus adspersus]|uniref:Grh/CP2 DB domain-containing protein n=1 Tax=Exocentrus adspersus TaxID=1586481 RepID=A0AAV8WC87_9CUCU|nr:hypothetical protein NQ315_006938 [Exocentrus adspersus]